VGTMGLAYDVAVATVLRNVRGGRRAAGSQCERSVVPGRVGSLRQHDCGLIGIIVEQSDVEVAGDHVYMTRTYCGEFTCFSNLGVIDVRTPTSPALVASVGNWNGWVNCGVER